MEQENGVNQEDIGKKKKRSKTVRKTSEPLPDKRLNRDKNLRILKALCAASNNGDKFVISQEIAPLANVHDTEAGGACSFFSKIDMVETKNYAYKPKETIIKFCNELEWTPDVAGKVLQEEFMKTWFGKKIMDFFKVNKESDKTDLIKILGRAAHADSNYHKRALSTLIDFLEYAHIIIYDENSKKYKVINQTGSQQKIEPESPDVPKNKKEILPKPVTPSLKMESLKPQQPNNVSNMVNINLDVKFSDDTDPEKLAEKIRKFKELIK